MFDTLQTFAEVAIGVAGFTGVIVAFRKVTDPLGQFRLKSLLSLSGEVILFSFVPQMLTTVLGPKLLWSTAAVAYGIFHIAQIVFSYRAIKSVEEMVDFVEALDQKSMIIGVLISVSLIIAGFSGYTNIAQLVYTVLLLWAIGIAGLQFLRILLLHTDKEANQDQHDA